MGSLLGIGAGPGASGTMVFDAGHGGKCADVKTVISLPSSRR